MRKPLSIFTDIALTETVAAVEILEALTAIKSSATPGTLVNSEHLNLENREQVLEALHLTRESLICGLMTEKIMRAHHQFIVRQQEMFSSVERNQQRCS